MSSTRAYSWDPCGSVHAGFLALENALERAVIFECPLETLETRDLLAAGVLDRLARLQIETPYARVASDVLQLLPPICRQSCGTRGV